MSPDSPNRFERHRRVILPTLIVMMTLALAALADGCAYVLYANALHLRGAAPFEHAARRIHNGFMRPIVQFVPDCSRYDAELFYTLRPGSCTVPDREHSATYSVNSEGLRDSEEALSAPQVIVLGDSHVMGWGVSGDETFASEVARQTDLRVLNAGVSSYATARETLMLERLDRSALETIVIVYSQNDDDENEDYVANDFDLQVSDEATYAATLQAEQYRPKSPPWPFYATRLVYFMGDYYVQQFKRMNSHERELEIARVEAENFVAILANAEPVFGDARIIVLEVNSNAENDRYFIEAVEAIRERGDAPSLFARLEILDTSTAVAIDDYFLLDDHMQASGHTRVGTLIANAILSR